MSTFTLTIGLVIREGQRTWRLDRTTADSRLVFLDLESGAPKTLTVAELQRDLLAGQLQVVQEHPVALSQSTGKSTSLVRTLQDLPLKEQERLHFRLAYVKHMLKQGLRKGMKARVRVELARLKGNHPSGITITESTPAPQVPRASTVVAWMQAFDTSGGNPLSLLSGNCFRKAPRRVHPFILELARRRIRDVYCSKKRPTAESVRLLVNHELKLTAEKAGIDAEQARISEATFRRLIREISPFDLCVARFGPAYARNKWRYSLGGVDAPRVLSRYEIDHTILDIVVIDDRTGLPLGRPTITVVVDSYSGYIAGFYISFWSAGLASAMSALKIAIQPKELFTGHLGLAQTWLAFGIPDLIVVDNGLEFHSRHFRAAAMHLASDVLYCAVRQPWLKPLVERAMRSINVSLPASGRVEKPLTNYLPEKPERNACVTFGALCLGLLKQIVEVHPFEINERRLVRPYDLYTEGLATQLAPRLTSSLSELDIIVAPTDQYVVGNEGVVRHYLRYNSPELQDLRRRVGHKFRTDIKANPEDISQIWVRDPDSTGWLQVPSCFPEYTTGLSTVQHKAIRDQKKSELTLRNAEAVLTKAKLEMADMWGSAIRSGRRLKGPALRAISTLTSRHVFGGSGQPSLSSSMNTQIVPVTQADLLPIPKEYESYEFN